MRDTGNSTLQFVSTTSRMTVVVAANPLKDSLMRSSRGFSAIVVRRKKKCLRVITTMRLILQFVSHPINATFNLFKICTNPYR